MYRKSGVMCILLVLAGAVCCFGITKAQMDKINQIPADVWEKVANCEAAWPEALFPMTTIPPKGLERMPRTYWDKVHADERTWENFIMEQAVLFQNEYGSEIKDLYDLFCYDQQVAAGDIPVAPCVKQKKTLERFIDYVGIDADRLSALQNAATEKIRVLIFKKGKLHIIPFDILETSAKGRLALPEGPEANPEDADGIFNNTDKIVFMAVDTGHKVGPDYIKKQFPNAAVISELKISYEDDDEAAWAYLAVFDGTVPPESPLDYSGLNAETTRIYSLFASGVCLPRVERGKTIPTIEVTSLFASPAGGGLPVDIFTPFSFVNNTKFRPLGSKTETIDDMDIRWRAWFDGKVIVYNRASWTLWTPFGIAAPIVYEDMIVTPVAAMGNVAFYVPFNPKLVVKHVSLSFGQGITPTCKEFGQGYFITKDREAVKIDGKMSEKEKELEPDYSTYILAGREGAMCLCTAYDKYTTENADIHLEWTDTPQKTAFTHHLTMTEFDNKMGNLTHEWNMLPFFYNTNSTCEKDRFNWDKLDLVLKRTEKPISCTVDDGQAMEQPRFLHVPNIAEQEDAYDY